jgi:hypothetical protein
VPIIAIVLMLSAAKAFGLAVLLVAVNPRDLLAVARRRSRLEGSTAARALTVRAGDTT